MSSICLWLNLTLALAMIYPLKISGCPTDDRNNLLHFRSRLLDPAGRLSSWQGYNCCEWKGIRCDSYSGHVISLDLRNPFATKWDWDKPKKLSGKISRSLFNLRKLQYLDLSYNDFIGTFISPEFSKLQSLTFLSLANAEFVGEIPAELGNITTLRHLDLSADPPPYPSTALRSWKFAGWIENLRNLEYLAMNNVDLSKGITNDDWRKAFKSLFNLREIHLSNCGLSGTLPSFPNLTHLSHLHLPFNYFYSTLPAWFQNVSSLVSLDISWCLLTGSIPSNFLHRSSLKNLDLSYNGYIDENYGLEGNLSFMQYQSSSIENLNLQLNRLDGIIPPFFANFTKLQRLVLADNFLTGDIPPLGKVSLPLSVFDLSRNKLTGNIPDTLFQSTGLEKLRLSTNNLKGSFSLSLMDNFTELRELGLSNNSFTVSISSTWIPQFPRLRYLGLRSCNIGGNFPAFLSTQYSLEDLDLSDNNIVGSIPTWMWDLPALHVITLSDNQLQGSLPSIISKQFERVDLKRNKLEGSLPSFKNPVFFFDGSENNFNGSIPLAIAADYILLSSNNLTGEIPSLCRGVYLDFSKNNLKGSIPNLWSCNNVMVLNLAHNNLQGEIPEQLGELSNLRTLNLYANNLQGTIPPNIMNCGFLTIFDVGGNQIQGNIPVLFSQLRRLRILNLASNKFEGTIPSFLVELKYLQILDLSHNSLSGPIPQNIGKLDAMVHEDDKSEFGSRVGESDIFQDYSSLISDEVTLWVKGRMSPYEKILKKLTFMDLSNNNLSGNIPPEVGLLKNLNALNFSRNNLSGPIPKSMGGLVNLESLDLSANKLSGHIPSELVNLTFLEVLNVSDNRLSGLIPRGNQFSTFEASSFAGNPGLHGPQLENRTLGGNSSEEGLHKIETEEEDEEMKRWWAISVGLSYGAGFATVIAVLCFHIRWRYQYFVFLDSFMPHLFRR